MADLAHFEAFRDVLDEAPLFLVEPTPKPGPDPRLWPELERQAAFIAYLRKTSPKITARAIPNEGKRGFKAQRAIKRGGVVAGTFDTLIFWDPDDATTADCPRSVAMIEFKGFTAAGRPGVLSQDQIDFGNDLHRKGHAVACCFTAAAALDFLRSLGAPIMGRMT